MSSEEESRITADLRSDDPQVVADTKTDIEAWFEKDGHAVSKFSATWYPSLMERQHYDIASDLCLKATFARIYSAQQVERFLVLRAEALLKAGKPKEALAAAHSAFNVAPMEGTAKAISLLDKCLRAANVLDAVKLSTQLRHEQFVGAEPPVGNAAANAKTSPSVLTMPLEAEVAEEHLKDLDPDDRYYLTTKGNLLLLAGRAKEANDVFRKLLTESDSTDLLTLHENIARAIRAEDGTIGRANAYILTLPEDLAGLATSKDPAIP